MRQFDALGTEGVSCDLRYGVQEKLKKKTKNSHGENQIFDRQLQVESIKRDGSPCRADSLERILLRFVFLFIISLYLD